MRLFHNRWRERAGLLAAGALEGPEREATLAHLDSCAECREEHAASLELFAALSKDPLRDAEVPLPLAVLVRRVEARLDPAFTSPAWRWGWGLAALPIAAVVVLTVSAIVRSTLPVAPRTASPSGILISEEMLGRLERNLVREHAVRYLNEAENVLVTIAASPRNCERESDRVDVGEEARRSRELLARGALLVEMDHAEVASARPVLEDVEDMLREVASLESCARARDLQAIHHELSRRRLLMKIDLMTRELQG